MAARKATRKSAAKKKTTRKKATKKAASRKSGKKKAARKKSARKKSAKKKASPRKAVKQGVSDLVGNQLPKSLAAFGRQLRRDLTAIEKRIEVAGKDTRRSLARIVRDASHQLGTLEARGEREWRSLSRNARRDVERVIKRVQKAAGV